MYTREDAIAAMRSKVQSIPEILAAWEGGSSATGYLDKYSDLDMYLVVSKDNHEAIYQQIIDFIEKTFGIEKMYRLPEPTPHGFRQGFVKTIKTPKLFYIDFVIMDETVDDKYLESNRHGKADFWIDKIGLNISERQEKVTMKMTDAMYQATVSRDFLIILELEKQIARNNFLEAFPLYISFISRCVVTLLNIKYRPEKSDFGMRYIYRDYPKEMANIIEDSFKVNSVNQLNDKYRELKVIYQDLIEELK